MKRRLLLAAALLSLTTTAIPAAAVSTDPMAALTQAAHPLLSATSDGQLRDLRPLTRDVGAATVVGIGDATHNSSEFFTRQQRAHSRSGAVWRRWGRSRSP